MAKLPNGIMFLHIIGIGFLASIGFTMSLFITELAFVEPQLIKEAKLGVLIASVVASFLGYFTMNYAIKRQ